jgi:signal transduction histidine kinase
VDIFEITYDELTALILTSDPRLDSGQTDSRDRVVVSVLGRPEADADQSAAQGQWRLVFKHRQGSLEAAVAGLRTRNILISFGALLLLGGSMAMLLISTRRAQRLAQQQIAFASAVSHELRTPLAVICSAGENLADGVVPDAQKARQYGAVIANEGRRLAEMVDQVLAFAGAQSGREPYHMQRTEVAPVIEGAIYALRPALRDGGFALELRLAPDLPPLNADAAALGRALQNLISNAMKYGAEDGWIGVTAEVIAGEAGRELQISVRDNGGKIHQEDLPHLFEPFYRGRSARATSSHGSGLGLSMVRHAVAAHGGRVSVESRPGVGTRFTLHLPLGGTMAVAQQAGATV